MKWAEDGVLLTSRWPAADWAVQHGRLIADAQAAWRAGLNGGGAMLRAAVCHWCWAMLPEGTPADSEHLEPRMTRGPWVDSPADTVLSCPPCNRGAGGKHRLREPAWMARLEPLAATLRGCPGAAGPRRAAWVRFRLTPQLRRRLTEIEVAADSVAVYWARAGQPLPELELAYECRHGRAARDVRYTGAAGDVSG